jgi:hypothetical protein
MAFRGLSRKDGRVKSCRLRAGGYRAASTSLGGGVVTCLRRNALDELGLGYVKMNHVGVLMGTLG